MGMGDVCQDPAVKCVCGVMRPSYRIVLAILRHSVTCRMIDDVLSGVIPPLPYYMGMVCELSESLPTAAARGEVF